MNERSLLIEEEQVKSWSNMALNTLESIVRVMESKDPNAIKALKDIPEEQIVLAKEFIAKKRKESE